MVQSTVVFIVRKDLFISNGERERERDERRRFFRIPDPATASRQKFCATLFFEFRRVITASTTAAIAVVCSGVSSEEEGGEHSMMILGEEGVTVIGMSSRVCTT
jgi:hypothetical protein